MRRATAQQIVASGRRLARAFDSESGFTLVEVLMAMVISALGVATTLGVFGTSHRSSLLAQRYDVAVQKAQEEMDRLQIMDYTHLVLNSLPATSSDPNDPDSRVVGSKLQVKSGLQEDLVTSSDPSNPGTVAPGPERFTVGSGGSRITGKIYRFISWRDENCPSTVCDGTQNTKRLTVAVTVDPSATIAPRPPLWISSIASDPKATPPASDLPPDADPGSGSSTEAQTFYLYDRSCNHTQQATPTQSHATQNTGATGSQASDYSTCSNSDQTKQPDLMWTTAPPGDDPTPLYTYSNDLSGTYPGGLAMKRRGNTCPTSYPGTDAQNPNALDEWNIHVWATNSMSADFKLSGRVAVSLYTMIVGGTSGRGMVCATLIDRRLNNGVPVDTVLDSSTYDNTTWPTDPTDLAFSFDLPQAATVAANHRLLFVLSVRGESDGDLVFLYDHPTYPSFIQVATSTPLP